MWKLYTQLFASSYLTGVHFRGELQHGGDFSQQKIKCWPIRTREIGRVSVSDVLHENIKNIFKKYHGCGLLKDEVPQLFSAEKSV